MYHIGFIIFDHRMKTNFIYILLIIVISTGFAKTISASEMVEQIDSLKTICRNRKR